MLVEAPLPHESITRKFGNGGGDSMTHYREMLLFWDIYNSLVWTLPNSKKDLEFSKVFGKSEYSLL